MITKLSKLKHFDMFTLKRISDPLPSDIYVKYLYSHRYNKIICYKLSDVDTYFFFKPTKKVYIDFNC